MFTSLSGFRLLRDCVLFTFIKCLLIKNPIFCMSRRNEMSQKYLCEGKWTWSDMRHGMNHHRYRVLREQAVNRQYMCVMWLAWNIFVQQIEAEIRNGVSAQLQSLTFVGIWANSFLFFYFELQFGPLWSNIVHACECVYVYVYPAYNTVTGTQTTVTAYGWIGLDWAEPSWAALSWVSFGEHVLLAHTNLLYIRMSGFHNLFGVIRKSLTPPYSDSFHFKL